jgi:hypothetical protein
LRKRILKQLSRNVPPKSRTVDATNIQVCTTHEHSDGNTHFSGGVMTSKKNMDNLSLDTNSDDDMSTASRFSHCQSSSNLPSADNMSIEPVNILLLGMSYPSIKETLQRKNAYIRLKHNDLSVDQAVELVGKKILSQADGRDYARITAVEASNEIRAYTVSYKKGGRYDDERHLSADFCHHSFLSQMRGLWGTVKFRKVRNSMLSKTGY